MAKLYRLRAAAVIVLGLVNEASLISAFKLTFPSLNSTSGATSITWDPQTSSCSFLTIQHQCLPDKYVTTRTSVSEKFKMMPIPVDWLERLIKNGTSHCRAVAQCEDGFPNVSTLTSIDVYMASNSKGQPTFSSVDTGSGASSSNSATQPTSTGSTTSPSTSTFVSAPASTTSGASTTDSSSSGGSQAKHASLGAILGGTLGGLAALLLGIFFLFWRQRRRRSSSEKPLVIETPEPSPRELPPLTPFVPSSPSSPNESFPSPNSDGYHIDTNVSPKSRMLAGLSATSSDQSGSSSEALGGATSSERTDSADGEVTRRQIMDLNSRIMQLEATRRESELEAAPPRYSVGS